MSEKHVIIGCNGAVGERIMKQLHLEGKEVLGIARSVVDTATTRACDIFDTEKLSILLQGATHVYGVFGLEYTTKIWQRDWPKVISGVVETVKTHNAKFIFLDNVYMYGLVNGSMTEESTKTPISNKGNVRKQVSEYLEQAMATQPILIARAADFYGKNVKTSMFNAMVIDNIKQNKTPMWLVNGDKAHSMANVDDVANAMILLASEDTNFGQTWHLPCSEPALTGKQYIQLAYDVQSMQSKKPMIMSGFMVRLIGLFMPVLKEQVEMLYQNSHAYHLDSTKFMNKYPNFPVTSYQEGIAKCFEV
jgi:nucleoside-diphosphate-sugar epimerase